MKAHSPYLPRKHTPHPLRPYLPTKQPNRCTCLAINNINHTSRLLVYRESCATHNYKQRRPPRRPRCLRWRAAPLHNSLVGFQACGLAGSWLACLTVSQQLISVPCNVHAYRTPLHAL